MSLREVRRLSMFALTLLCLPILALGAVSPIVTVLVLRRTVGSAGVAGLALIPAGVLATLIWLTWRHGETVGRVFAPLGLDGPALFGCTAIRVLCLRQMIVGLCVGAQQTLPAIGAGGMYALFGVTWQAWCVNWFMVPAVSLALFFAAPWIAERIVGQVDSGVMWWSTTLRGLSRLGSWLKR
jgi:hypothetical protein